MVQQALQYFYEDLITKDTIKGVVLIINNSGVIVLQIFYCSIGIEGIKRKGGKRNTMGS